MPRRKATAPKRMSIEDLALITGRFFEHLEKTIGTLADQTVKGFARMDENFKHIDARLDAIRQDIADLDDLRERVLRLEARLGIKR